MRISSSSTLLFLATSSQVHGFTLQSPFVSINTDTRLIDEHLSSALYGRKRGNLGKTVSAGGVTTKKKRKGGKNKESSKKDEGPAKISNSLSQWAATLDTSADESAAQNINAGDDNVSISESSKGASSFEPFQPDDDTTNAARKKSTGKAKGGRRERSKNRQKNDQIVSAQIDAALEEITTLISSNNLPVDVLLQNIQSLTQLKSPMSLKALLNSNTKDYNLAWVGSDDAICHMGTGLHKVPLARLQEIFLTIGRDGSGKSKTVRLMEIISILGPFPNVRNTLQGEILNLNTQESLVSGEPTRVDKIRIKYDSMMDGLGKEIDAGTDDNMRYVDLDVVFADTKALVCVVPNDGDSDSDGIFDNDGKNVLLFLKEDDVDYKLEELRAA